MRLGDSDALYDKVIGHVTSVSVCATVQQSIGQTDFKRRCLEDIHNATTVDAIPVEWLRQLQRIMPHTAAVMGVDVVLKMWQKKQEAQDG